MQNAAIKSAVELHIFKYSTELAFNLNMNTVLFRGRILDALNSAIRLAACKMRRLSPT